MPLRRLSACGRFGLAIAALFLTSVTVDAKAREGEPVILRSPDGSVVIAGELVRIEDARYVVQTRNLGEMKVDAARVFCFGQPCPVTSMRPRPRP